MIGKTAIFPLVALLALNPVQAETGNESVSAAASVPLNTRVSVQQYQSIIDRMLFSPFRRSRERGSDNSTQNELEKTWQLVGVIVEDEHQMVLFRDRERNLNKRVELGASLSGDWVVEEITELSALLTNGVDEMRFELTQPRALEYEQPAGTEEPPVAEAEPSDAPTEVQAEPANNPEIMEQQNEPSQGATQ